MNDELIEAFKNAEVEAEHQQKKEADKRSERQRLANLEDKLIQTRAWERLLARRRRR
jgi:hypothetical protein